MRSTWSWTRKWSLRSHDFLQPGIWSQTSALWQNVFNKGSPEATEQLLVWGSLLGLNNSGTTSSLIVILSSIIEWENWEIRVLVTSLATNETRWVMITWQENTQENQQENIKTNRRTHRRANRRIHSRTYRRTNRRTNRTWASDFPCPSRSRGSDVLKRISVRFPLNSERTITDDRDAEQ